MVTEAREISYTTHAHAHVPRFTGRYVSLWWHQVIQHQLADPRRLGDLSGVSRQAVGSAKVLPQAAVSVARGLHHKVDPFRQHSLVHEDGAALCKFGQGREVGSVTAEGDGLNAAVKAEGVGLIDGVAGGSGSDAPPMFRIDGPPFVPRSTNSSSNDMRPSYLFSAA
jgi:hypothetical protein